MIGNYPLPTDLRTHKENYKAFLLDVKSHAKKSIGANFPIGTHVVVLTSPNQDTKEVFKSADDSFYIGTVCELRGRIPRINWGTRTWWLDDTGITIEAATFQTLITKYSIPREIDLSHLEKLIIDEQSKKEIVQVMKQFKNMKKIFEEWGLGEVIEYGKAMSLLFYGPPGTGKTWGANCIAKALGKDLLVVSAAEIQTSEPGGANRNIQKAFETAKARGCVLFFDECDSLITDRAHVGMILASEINTLLTSLETFEGIVIFATNRADTLDPAMARRISLMVEFKNPSEETREEIWKMMIPKKMPLAKDVNIKQLAKIDLTGGYIKNALLNAARAAVSEGCDAVHKRHFGEAIKRIKETKDIMGTHVTRQHDFVKARG